MIQTPPTPDLPEVPGLRLRPSRVADQPFLLRLYRSSRDAELAATGWDEAFKRAFCRQQFQARHTDWARRHPEAVSLVILRNRQPIGCVIFDEAAGHLQVVDLALLPEARGRGYGSAVLTALADRAASRGAATVGLSVDPRNTRAAALYRRLGFVETGRDPSRIRLTLFAGAAGVPPPP